MNKRIGIFAIAMLLLGAGSSVAMQSFAQTSTSKADVQVSTTTSIQADQKDAQGNDLETNDDSNVTAEQKDANGNDAETNDDLKLSLGSEKDSVNDNDSDSKSEQGEKDGGQANVAEQAE